MKLLYRNAILGMACSAAWLLPSAASAQVSVTAGHAAALSADQPTALPDTATSAAAGAGAATSIVEVWSASEGTTLSDTLAGWAQRAGWKLIWESDSDFRLAASGQIEGSFQDAAEQMIKAFGRTRPRLRATFYEGNSVLRVWAERAEP